MKSPTNSFKNTSLFLWDAEPSAQKAGAVFFDSDSNLPSARAQSRTESKLGAWIIVISLTVGGGIVALVELARVLRTGHF